MNGGLVHRIKEARHALMQLRINERERTYDRDTMRDVMMIDSDYTSLGKNKEAREAAFSAILRDDQEHSEMAAEVRFLESECERAEFELEAVLDERRYHENVTWAKLADYLTGRVDHVNNAPYQAAKTAMQERIKEEVLT